MINRARRCDMNALVAIAFLLMPTPMAAQDSAEKPRIGITVALVDKLPDAADLNDIALIVQREHDRAAVILLPAERATGEALAAAVFKLMLVRQMQPDVPEGSYIRVPRAIVPERWLPGEVTRASRVIERARSRSVVNLPGLGRGRTYTLYIPRNGVVTRTNPGGDD